MQTKEEISAQIIALEKEWDRLDDLPGGNYTRQNEIAQELERLRFRYEHLTTFAQKSYTAPETAAPPPPKASPSGGTSDQT